MLSLQLSITTHHNILCFQLVTIVSFIILRHCKHRASVTGVSKNYERDCSLQNMAEKIKSMKSDLFLEYGWPKVIPLSRIWAFVYKCYGNTSMYQHHWIHQCMKVELFHFQEYGPLCISPMGIHQCMWIQLLILQKKNHILHTYYVDNEWSHVLFLNQI